MSIICLLLQKYFKSCWTSVGFWRGSGGNLRRSLVPPLPKGLALRSHHSLQPSELETLLGQTWHRPLGQWPAPLPHSSPWEKLLLKPSPNPLQLALLCLRLPACAAVRGPAPSQGFLWVLGAARCSRAISSPGSPSPQLPPHSANAAAPPPCIPPSTLQLVHITPVPADTTRCGIWMWSDRSHTRRDNPFPWSASWAPTHTAQIISVFWFTQKEITPGF